VGGDAAGNPMMDAAIFRPECLPGVAWRVVASAMENRLAKCHFPAGALPVMTRQD